jgi:hypothetical protein
MENYVVCELDCQTLGFFLCKLGLLDFSQSLELGLLSLFLFSFHSLLFHLEFSFLFSLF